LLDPLREEDDGVVSRFWRLRAEKLDIRAYGEVGAEAEEEEEEEDDDEDEGAGASSLPRM